MNYFIKIIVIYLVINSILIYTKPHFCFNNDKSFKRFGIGKECSFITITSISLGISIFLLILSNYH